jgi:hypothetical protein
VGLGPQRHWAWPGKVAWPIWLFWLLTENRGALLPIDTDGLWSTVEWPRSKPAGWRRRGGGGSLDGSSIAEGISGRGRTSASRSRGHLWGPSGWRGSTRRHDAWCGVEAVGQGLKRAVYGAQWWCARRCNGGEAGGGERKRKGAPRWGSPFIAARGGGMKAVRWRSHGWQNGGGSHNLDVIGTVWAPTFRQWGWQVVPRGFRFFSICPKLAQPIKLKRMPSWLDLHKSAKNSPFLYEASFKYSKELYILCWLQTPNKNKVKNPRTDSILESLMNFKGIQSFWKNLINYSKFFLDLIFTKVNLVGYTCM